MVVHDVLLQDDVNDERQPAPFEELALGPRKEAGKRSATWTTPGFEDVEFVETLDVLEVSGHDSAVGDRVMR